MSTGTTNFAALSRHIAVLRVFPCAATGGHHGSRGFQALADQLWRQTIGQREALAETIEVRASTNDAIALIDCRFAALSRLQTSRCRHVVEAQASDALRVTSNALEPALGMREWRPEWQN